MLGAPSPTARRVAAYRLQFERIDVPYGDALADRTLAQEVAGEVDGSGRPEMVRYLQARTTFFDRVVVDAIDRGVTQMVNLGAGYDGRCLRYAKPGVQWWEIDRAETQGDKVARLRRLGLESGHVRFVPHDLAQAGTADALTAAGYVPDAAGMFICEGVAAYLPDAVVQALLQEVRSLVSVGTRLALSIATEPTSDGHAARRRSFQAAVAGLGEPAVGSLRVQDLDPLLTATRWSLVQTSERASRAGFVVVAPM